MDEEQASNLLRLALANNQAAELLNCLFAGGAITVDPIRKRIVTISADQLEVMRGG